jgi:hypothetical protein
VEALALALALPQDAGLRAFGLQNLVSDPDKPGKMKWRLNFPVLKSWSTKLMSFPGTTAQQCISAFVPFVSFGEQLHWFACRDALIRSTGGAG